MTSTFDTVAGIISEICDLPREKIMPESHVTEDLGVDSLAFLDAVFTIDQHFSIKIPLEEWTNEVNEGKVRGSRYFVLKNFCDEVDKLVAAGASTATAG
ncbi:MAG: acyl carrier protein [Hyphomicrobiaceae bacterium]|nr:acyl carrier protein [Hyphomicrobiaceae bacterium]